jgi:hypothetical protein
VGAVGGADRDRARGARLHWARGTEDGGLADDPCWGPGPPGNRHRRPAPLMQRAKPRHSPRRRV